MAMLPPIQEASADVGSTAKTKPARSAASVTRFVTTPAPDRMLAFATFSPAAAAISTGPSVSSFSVLMMADHGVNGTAPPVYPVPPPRGMMVNPSSIQSRTRFGISVSRSGARTTKR